MFGQQHAHVPRAKFAEILFHVQWVERQARAANLTNYASDGRRLKDICERTPSRNSKHKTK